MSTKIVLIEDDSFLSGMYATKLGLEGYQVFQATDGEKGLRLIVKERPQVILLDLIMPGMDGFAVLKEMQKDPSLSGIPVIVLSNLGEKASVEQALKLGAKDYLIKAHFLPSEVISKIKKVLAGAGSI